MSERFEESVHHHAHGVLGLRLQPFTFWHAWQLDFAQSPYAGHAVECGPEETALAALICSYRPRELNFRPRLAGWQRRILARRAARDSILRRSHRAFLAYLADHDAPPKTWEKDDAVPVKSPWYLYFVAVLMRSGRKTEPEAWATEVGYGKHLAMALAEAGGADVPLLTPQEIKAMKEAGW